MIRMLSCSREFHSLRISRVSKFLRRKQIARNNASIENQMRMERAAGHRVHRKYLSHNTKIDRMPPEKNKIEARQEWSDMNL